MNPKVLGISLSDISTGLIFYPDDEAITFPTIISKKKGEDSWVVGEAAYGLALDGKGIITDKLLKLARKRGIATIDGVRYEGKEILKIFFREIIDCGMKKLYKEKPDKVVVAMTGLAHDIVIDIKEALLSLGYLPNNIHIISKEESFIYFVLSLKKDVWNNRVGMFDLSDISLTYYEMIVNRNTRKLFASAESENMDEAFNVQILGNPSGAKLADKILTSVAMKVKGVDIASEGSIYNVVCVCEGRINADVFIQAIKEGKDCRVYLGKVGDYWRDLENEILLIPDESENININIILDFLPKRPIKSRKIKCKSSFSDSRVLNLEISDMGFGDMYPATDSKKNIEVSIWD